MRGRGAARRALFELGRTGPARRALSVLLNDPETLAWLVRHLSDRRSAEASFEASLERAPAAIRGFEDLTWLYTEGPLNHGLSRLTFGEAAYLYRLVAGLDEPRVAEVGRYRGGTTFLLAAAGAHVLSVDIDAGKQAAFQPGLELALERFGLRDRVELAVADSRTLPLEGRRFDLVFLDAATSYEGMHADVEHWLPAVEAGGHLVLDSLDPDEVRAPALLPRFEGVRRLIGELDGREGLERRPGAPPAFAHYRTAPQASR